MTHNVPQVRWTINYVMFQIYFFERIPRVLQSREHLVCISAGWGKTA
ncbi:hypothetical protein HMPREF0742_00152 [Rothia aeria F0184]|uniref:Uncharacterized protein n=1 Tax=Rothia aeria F0184 TaxID=888019 RepID=U7V7M1_9MICC|nr:hypothetical protein HMPREF0742_00152 [Rothia aeria F0184]